MILIGNALAAVKSSMILIVTIVRDGDSDDFATVEQTTKERNNSVRADLRAGGGFIARFAKQ